MLRSSLLRFAPLSGSSRVRGGLAVVAFLFCLGAAGSAGAATFTVNVGFHAVDANLGDGICTAVPNANACTLHAAVAEANAAPTDDVIVFDPSLTFIKVTTQIGIGGTGNHGSLLIEGPGPSLLTIGIEPFPPVGGGNVLFSTIYSPNRVLGVTGGPVVIRGVTLFGGRQHPDCERTCNFGYIPGGDTCASVEGGGVMVAYDGGHPGAPLNLTLDRVVIRGGQAWVFGGAMAIYSFNPAAAVRIINSTIHQNRAVGSKAEGGAIWMNGEGATLYIANSTIVQNKAHSHGEFDGDDWGFKARGGGIYTRGVNLHIRNSTILANTATRTPVPFPNNVGYNEVIGDEIFIDSNFGGTNSVGNSILGFFTGGTTVNGINSVGHNNLRGNHTNSVWQPTDTFVSVATASSGAAAPNGGPTPTSYFTSPTATAARNSGSNALAVDPFDNSPLLTDQRGTTRIFGGTVDKGAVEIYDSITVSSTNLPGGQQGVPYSAFIQPTSGIPPHTFALDPGSTLPANLSLNTTTGEISGTPLVNGTFNFTIKVTDSNTTQTGGRAASPENVGTNQNFQLVIQGPTAASVSVSGRVLRQNNSGIAKVRVSLRNANGETRTALTNSFGYYRLVGVPAGGTYVLSGAHRTYQFDPQVLKVIDEISDADLIAASGGGFRKTIAKLFGLR